MKKTFFWFGLIFTGFNLLPLPDDGSFPSSPNREPITIVVNSKEFLAQELCSEFRGGGREDYSFLGKRKKFNLAYHRRLEKRFPDWQNRIDYQKKQEELYKSAMKKQREIKRLKDVFYTKEELDAIDYFHGTGIYRKHQDPRVKPNIFDTRQSFLLKMHDDQMRDEFLASFNRKN